MRTIYRGVFMPTLTSRRITRVGKRFQLIAQPPIERGRHRRRSDRSGPAQDLGAVAIHHADVDLALAVVRLGGARLDLFAGKDRVAIVRRDAAGLEPRLAPQLRAQRRELAEMGRALDGRGLEAHLLRHRIVVDRDVTVVELRGEHLLRRSPRPDERLAVIANQRVESPCGHGRLPRYPKLEPEYGRDLLPTGKRLLLPRTITLSP
jgi:hypothetical protein